MFLSTQNFFYSKREMQIPTSLINACIAGEQIAQKQLYELLLPYLRAVAVRYVRDVSYEKDVLQVSFVKIFKHLERYDAAKAPLKKWAAKIVINSCFNFNERIIGTPKDEFLVDQHEIAIAASTIQHISDAHFFYILKQMPKDYFEVFNLFIIDEYKHLEIAEMLHISEASSRKRLSRARDWLKKTFRERPNWLAEMESLHYTQN